MMNATTDATKLNFMTDHGSTRDSVSMAWRLVDLRAWMPLGAAALRFCFCQALVTELARPAAAPPIAEAVPAAAEPAAPALEESLLDE
jgi:hypothetical protein